MREMMTRKCPEHEIRDGSRNIGLLAFQPPDVAVSPKEFYTCSIQSQ